ncbi:MAG: PTS glucose transporter subunit IIA [Oscillospiraceae bacterium]|nr:PTS glucose transporter subunit IIA [Oscillospiraceae bacterium]
MGLFDKLFKKEESPKVVTEKGVLYAPISGKYIPLEEVPDVVFSQGILGPGCGIEPEDGICAAPADGTVTQVTDTKHAVGITTEDGAEILIHIGMDTVEMGGDGFVCKVKEGQKVNCGQTLITFDMKKIEAAGHPTCTAFVLTNPDDYPDFRIETGSEYKRTDKVGILK